MSPFCLVKMAEADTTILENVIYHKTLEQYILDVFPVYNGEIAPVAPTSKVTKQFKFQFGGCCHLEIASFRHHSVTINTP